MDQQQQQYAAAVGQTETFGQSAPASEATLSASNRRLSFKLRWLAIPLGIVLVAGATAYYLLYLQNPNVIAAKALANFGNSDTSSFKANVEMTEKHDVKQDAEDKTAPSDNLKLTVNADGQLDSTDPNKTRLSTILKGTYVSGSDTVNVAGEVRLPESQDLYAKLTEVPDMLGLGIIKNKWIRVPEKQVFDEKQSTVPKLNANNKKQIESIIRKEQPIQIAEVLKDEKVDGQTNHHYKLGYNKDGIKRAYPQVMSIAQGKAPAQDEITDFNKAVDGSQLPTAEVWIGKKDNFPHKIQVEVTEKTDAEDSVYESKVAVVVSLSNYNQPVQIETPKDAKSYEAAAAALGISENETDTDKDGLIDPAEEFYGSDKSKPDSDGDRFKDGDEVKKCFNPAGKGKIEGCDPKSLLGSFLLGSQSYTGESNGGPLNESSSSVEYDDTPERQS